MEVMDRPVSDENISPIKLRRAILNFCRSDIYDEFAT